MVELITEVNVVENKTGMHVGGKGTLRKRTKKKETNVLPKIDAHTERKG